MFTNNYSLVNIGTTYASRKLEMVMVLIGRVEPETSRVYDAYQLLLMYSKKTTNPRKLEILLTITQTELERNVIKMLTRESETQKYTQLETNYRWRSNSDVSLPSLLRFYPEGFRDVFCPFTEPYHLRSPTF